MPVASASLLGNNDCICGTLRKMLLTKLKQILKQTEVENIIRGYQIFLYNLDKIKNHFYLWVFKNLYYCFYLKEISPLLLAMISYLLIISSSTFLFKYLEK